ncbi:unnamed protein product [Linum trigynum]|uniref:Transposase n=1 Tax=Linum trigynum TaxID=586398 RepID=A0AAV2GFR2_9ROSI
MADSWDELVGENDPNHIGHDEASLGSHNVGDAYVAPDIYHVYDSDDAMTSDDEYHEARANLRAYGEGRKRKVIARVAVGGEEVDQLEEFEEDDSENEDDEGKENGENSHHSIPLQNTEPPEEPQPPEQPQPPRFDVNGEGSQHSNYRLLEDSDHVRGNLSNEEDGDLYDDAPRYDPLCDHKQLEFVCRMKFDGVEQFKDGVVRHSVAHEAYLRWIQSNPTRREVKCKDENCPWRLYASWFKKDKCFMLRKVGLPHSCARRLSVNQVTAKWIASDMLERFRINPEWAPEQIMVEVKLKHNMEVKKRTCYRAKVEAIKILSGSLSDEYNLIKRYLAELKKRDRDGRFQLEVDPHPDEDKCLFKRLYVGFSCLKDGFLWGCRPMFGLDGCFLKGEVKGMLLTTVGKYGNNQMFPIAWAVVEGENTNSWTWFVDILTKELGLIDGRGWTVISDQHKV